MRRRRGLSEEEARLWEGVARQATPLHKKHAFPEIVAAPPAPLPATAPAGATDRPRPAGPAPAPNRSQMPSYQAPAQIRPPSLHAIEKPVVRKLAKGRVAIEARIDLHDKTQMVAHMALLGFLRQAQAMGMRHVLVITGRGSPFGSRGVIRRALPHWFDTPEFRSLVSGYGSAERGHGGEGAFYVRVRRR